jgi:uncharacterized RDD family membrane protein YckC
VTSERPTERRIDPLSPGARAIQGLRAGVVTRTLAGGVDYLLVVVLTLGTYVGWAVLLFLFNPVSYRLPEWPFWIFLIIGFSYFVLYLWIGFAVRGRTVGARVMGVRVVGARGGRMNWLAALLRALLYAVFPIGLWWCAVSRENRSVQDMLLRTSVVHDWPVPKAEVVIDDVERKRVARD